MDNVLKRVSDFCERAGAEWVVWLLAALLLVVVATAVRRVWAMSYLAGDIAVLVKVLAPVLSGSSVLEKAQTAVLVELRRNKSVAAALSEAAVAQAHRGPVAAAQAVETFALIERLRVERGLGILSTIATNAPFVGLLGTVIGVMHAFAALGVAQAQADLTGPLMRGVAEALVTTGVGLAVALPAVVAHNYLESRGEAALSSARALAGQVIFAMTQDSRAPSADGEAA